VPQARGIVKKADLAKLNREMQRENEHGEIDSNVTGHGAVCNINALNDVIVGTNNHIDSKKDAVLEAMDERYENRS